MYKLLAKAISMLFIMSGVKRRKAYLVALQAVNSVRPRDHRYIRTLRELNRVKLELAQARNAYIDLIEDVQIPMANQDDSLVELFPVGWDSIDNSPSGILVDAPSTVEMPEIVDVYSPSQSEEAEIDTELDIREPVLAQMTYDELTAKAKTLGIRPNNRWKRETLIGKIESCLTVKV